MIRLFASVFSSLALGVVFAVAGLAGIVQLYSHDLPSHEELREYQPKILTRVYSGSGDVIAEFARQRRVFVPIDEVPELLKQAFISAEDKHFYTHPGVDGLAIAKAIGRFAEARLSGRDARLGGASGITQQVVKNMLVGDERSVERKIREAILAVRVDGALSKDQILELYLNDIYLGARAYGVVAAAANYFGKTLEELSPAEIAYLAGLPVRPSHLHPIRNHDAALARRNYVLREMHANGYLGADSYAEALETPLDTILGEREPTVLGDARPNYFTDQVRRQLISEVGVQQLYHGGLTVRATIDEELQEIAQAKLRKALERYDRGTGTYRGPIDRIEAIAEGAEGAAESEAVEEGTEDGAEEGGAENGAETDGTESWQAQLRRMRTPGDIAGWHAAVVLEVTDDGALVGLRNKVEGVEDDKVRLRLSREREWIKRIAGQGAPNRASDIWQKGDVILVEREQEGWAMRQIPEVQGAFMAMDPDSGRVLAMVGGFSYESSTFNRATQARRQPGSAFKPFVYAAALDSGYRPDTIVLDAPIAIQDGRKMWRPKNSGGNFAGPLPLRQGLELSKNLMTVRIAQAVGMDRVAEYAERFGVYENMPLHFAYALGAGETTLYQMVAAYGMFANGGKRVEPTLIDRVQDRYGETLYNHDPRFCQGCEVETFRPGHTPVLFDARSQIMDPDTAWNLVTMMRGVVDHGTASSSVGGLGFPVAGKTGTTNDSKDVWFVGFTRNLVAGCYIGFDSPRSLGRSAYGATLCAPVFREFMAEAMQDREPGEFTPPRKGQMVTMKFDERTGERVEDDAEGPYIISQSYSLGVEPEILVDDRFALADDATLFGDYGADLPYILPEGEDVPLGHSGSDDWEGEGGSTVSRPPSIGLGTGGVY